MPQFQAVLGAVFSKNARAVAREVAEIGAQRRLDKMASSTTRWSGRTAAVASHRIDKPHGKATKATKDTQMTLVFVSFVALSAGRAGGISRP
jgi:hypothetical protein